MYYLNILNQCYSFIYVISLYFLQEIHCQVTKCCPIGSTLNIRDDRSFICESSINQTDWEAHNILPPSLPNCTATKSVFEGDNWSVKINGCIDKDSRNQIVAVNCAENPPTSVFLMKKCCPVEHSYDYNERRCKKDTKSSKRNLKFLFETVPIVFDNQVPECSEKEAFVEYFSIHKKIRFSGKYLEVNDNRLLPDKFCVDNLINIDASESNKENHLIIRSCRSRNVCDEIPCIRRCCKADQIMQPQPKGKRQCQNHPNSTNLTPTFHDIRFPLSNSQQKTRLIDYGVLQSWKCKKTFKLSKYDPDDLHYLHKNGMLYVIDQEPYDSDNYCIENILTPTGSTEAHAFLCFDEENYEELTKFDYYPYGLSISCIFLAITILVYLSLPKLLSVRGKTLVCYIISLLAAYITLAVLQFNKQNRSDLCYEVAFFLLYCLIASFCWQTIMCFDIWITFGHLRSSFVFRHNEHNTRKFVCYSAYGWGVPLIWILFTLYAEIFKPLPEDWNPVVAVNACFLDDRLNWRNHFLFFVMPAGIHVVINCILFVVIAVHCNRLKTEIHRRQCIAEDTCLTTRRKKFIILRAIFIMNLKLFTVMGISWVLEIISTFSTNETVEFVLDTYNLFLGVFIFIIFVLKRKVLYELKLKFGLTSKNTGTTTPGSISTTYDETCMKELNGLSEKNVPLLTSHDPSLPTTPPIINFQGKV